MFAVPEPKQITPDNLARLHNGEELLPLDVIAGDYRLQLHLTTIEEAVDADVFHQLIPQTRIKVTQKRFEVYELFSGPAGHTAMKSA